MKTRNITVLWTALVLAFGSTLPFAQAEEIPYTDTFFHENCSLKHRGVNDYFLPLKPGCYLLFEGEDEGETVHLLITILPGSKTVDGVKCAIMREMEWADGELVEISWNYVAFCRQHQALLYYGEDVDIYEDDVVVSHDGAWLAGENGNKPGILMPGLPLNGSRYYQEVAVGIAEDRAEHQSNTYEVDTPAGTFENCLSVEETSPLDEGATSFKVYARGIGLVQDGPLFLIDYGCQGGGLDFEPDGGGE